MNCQFCSGQKLWLVKKSQKQLCSLGGASHIIMKNRLPRCDSLDIMASPEREGGTQRCMARKKKQERKGEEDSANTDIYSKTESQSDYY